MIITRRLEGNIKSRGVLITLMSLVGKDCCRVGLRSCTRDDPVLANSAPKHSGVKAEIKISGLRAFIIPRKFAERWG